MPGKRLNSQAQELVLNVLEYFEREKENGGPTLPVNAVYEVCILILSDNVYPVINLQRVCDALHISRQTVYAIKQRKMRNPILSSPGKKRPRAKPKTKDLRESSKMEVRNTVYNMYKERKHVTLQSLKDELKAKEIVSLSRQSLAILLKDIGFKFRKEDNRLALVERHYVALMRSVFLKKYMDNLASSTPRSVVFLDETWIYSKGNKGKSWQDDSVKSVRKPEGYDGKRFIILHAGTENGFINGASLIFASNNKLADYHASMNSTKFEEWVTTLLLPNIPENSLILMDNAPYHSIVLNKVPTMVSRKQTIMDWLHENNVNFSTDLTKYQLLDLVKRNKPEKKYAIDEVIKAHGHDVLRLPPYHCEFNAIELIWASAKGYYDKHIGRNGYRDDNVLTMWSEALEHCCQNTWENCVRHTNKLIRDWYEREKHLADIEIEPIIINPGESSTSEEEFDSD